jgi:hypothetical protein
MWSFGALCDEFCVSTRMFFKLEMDPSRETMLHFFDLARKGYPRLTRLRRRDDGALLLDEDSPDEAGPRRFIRLEPRALKLGTYGPPTANSVRQFAEKLLSAAPYHLSLSELDYDYMDIVFNFDLEYRGNHDELVAETLFPEHPLLRALGGDGQRIIDCQPFLGVALGPDCDKQVYLEMKGRTSTFELRSGEYEPTPLSVQLTARRYWGLGQLPPLVDVHRDLLTIAEQYAADRIVPHVIKPLAAAIANRL